MDYVSFLIRRSIDKILSNQENSRAHLYCKHWNRENLGPKCADRGSHIFKRESKTQATASEPHDPSIYTLSMDKALFYRCKRECLN